MSVREGVGYNKVYLSGHGPEEGLSWSSEREPFAHSPITKRKIMTKRKEREDRMRTNMRREKGIERKGKARRIARERMMRMRMRVRVI